MPKFLITVLYIIGIAGLFLYSFTQLDLSLTFTRFAPLQELFQSFQYIGYFDRQLSTGLYLVLLVLLFVCYLFFLRMAFLKKIATRSVWKLILFTTILLLFSYNAFSYDLFNYIYIFFFRALPKMNI